MKSTITLTSKNIPWVALLLNNTLRGQTICQGNFKEVLDTSQLDYKQATTSKAYARAAVALTCDRTGLSLFSKPFLSEDFLEREVVAKIGDVVTVDADKIVCIHNSENSGYEYKMTALGFITKAAA